jgi:hypothetical protein
LADAIPSASAPLLAAQAQNGQQGVQAYQDAIKSLGDQRQAAVQQAMQESALRGSPAGSMGSIQSTMTAPYDQRIASLTQGQANYTAADAARQGRMDDYMNSVQATRSFIPLEAQASVAPILAQSQGALALSAQNAAQGRQQSGLDFQLTMAKMQAAAQAQQIAQANAARKAAAAKQQTLNQSQLGGILGGNVASSLSDAANTVTQMIAADEQKRRTAGMAATAASRLPPSQDAAAHQAAADAQTAQLAAAYGGRGLAQAKTTALAAAAGQAVTQQQGTGTGGGVAAPSASPQLPPLVRPPGSTAAEWQRYQDYMNQLRANQGPMSANPGFVQQSTQVQTPLTAAQMAAVRLAALQAPPTPAVTRQQNQYQGYLNTAKTTQQQVGQFGLQRLLQPLKAAPQVNAARNIRANTTVGMPGTTNQVGLSPSELAGLNPLQQYMVTTGLGAGSLMTPESFGASLGDPNLGGGPSQGSSDIVRAAYQQAFNQLQGTGAYNVGPEDLAAVMPDKGQSVYDYLQNAAGLPSSAQQVAAATKQGVADTKAGTAAQKAADKAQMDANRTKFQGDTGVPLPANDATATAILQTYTSEAFQAVLTQYDKLAQTTPHTKTADLDALINTTINGMASGLNAADIPAIKSLLKLIAPKRP